VSRRRIVAIRDLGKNKSRKEGQDQADESHTLSLPEVKEYQASAIAGTAAFANH
jgi:hypothetical protein